MIMIGKYINIYLISLQIFNFYIHIVGIGELILNESN